MVLGIQLPGNYENQPREDHVYYQPVDPKVLRGSKVMINTFIDHVIHPSQLTQNPETVRIIALIKNTMDLSKVIHKEGKVKRSHFELDRSDAVQRTNTSWLLKKDTAPERSSTYKGKRIRTCDWKK